MQIPSTTGLSAGANPKKEEIYVSRKEAEESIKRLLIEEAYEKTLSEKEEDTRIQMNEKVYESLQSNT